MKKAYNTPVTEDWKCLSEVIMEGPLPLNTSAFGGEFDAPARKANPLNGQIDLN